MDCNGLSLSPNKTEWQGFSTTNYGWCCNARYGPIMQSGVPLALMPADTRAGGSHGQLWPGFGTSQDGAPVMLFLDLKSLFSVIHVPMISCLDNCNVVFVGLSLKSIQKLPLC